MAGLLTTSQSYSEPIEKAAETPNSTFMLIKTVQLIKLPTKETTHNANLQRNRTHQHIQVTKVDGDIGAIEQLTSVMDIIFAAKTPQNYLRKVKTLQNPNHRMKEGSCEQASERATKPTNQTMNQCVRESREKTQACDDRRQIECK